MLNKNIKKMGFGGTYKLCKNKRKNIDSYAEQRQTFALDRFGGIPILAVKIYSLSLFFYC